MNIKLFSIFDKKTGDYGQLIQSKHTGEILREWDHLVKDKNTKYGKNPEDFSLFQIGNYNPDNGIVETITPHLHIADGIQ